MNDYRKICSKFSEPDGFNGWVIAKVEIDNLSDNTFDTTCVEECTTAKKRKRFAVLETSWEIETANSVKEERSNKILSRPNQIKRIQINQIKKFQMIQGKKFKMLRAKKT